MSHSTTTVPPNPVIQKYTTPQAIRILESLQKELQLDEVKLFLPEILRPLVSSSTQQPISVSKEDITHEQLCSHEQPNIAAGCDIDLDTLQEVTSTTAGTALISTDRQKESKYVATAAYLVLDSVTTYDEDSECEDIDSQKDDESTELHPIDGGSSTPYIRPLKDLELIRNCIDMIGKCCPDDNHASLVDNEPEEVDVFCKVSALIPPISFMRDADQHSDLSRYPLEPYYQDLAKSDNSAGNVELIALYLLSGLTSSGLASGFPLFYGGATGRARIYFHDVTDEVPDFQDESWFCEATRNGELDLCYVKVDNLLDDGIEDLLRDTDDEDFLDDSDTEDDMLDSISNDSQEDNISVAPRVDNLISTLEDDLDTELADTLLEQSTTSITNSLSNQQSNKLMDRNLNEDDSLDDDAYLLDNRAIGGGRRRRTSGCDSPSDSELMGDGNMYYLKLKNYPVSVALMETMEITLDELLSDDFHMSRTEWLSVLFQTAYNMAVANHCYGLVHNDLHNQNIMLDPCEEEYLYYQVNGQLYKVPTFGRMVKIIDFARATFTYNGQLIMSDMFAPNGEAAGQYTYIPMGSTPEDVAHDLGYTNTDALHLPNPSFDMIYLAYTIMPDLDENEHADIIAMLRQWSVSSLDGSNILDKECDFGMYVDIAHNCHQAVPIDLLSSGLLHEEFKVDNDNCDLSAEAHVYQLDTR